MRGHLGVRINDGRTDRIVTNRTRNLSFRKTAPGGFASASCTVVVPRSTFSDLGSNDRLYIYDSRTGRTVWEGYTENPGAVDGAEGQSFDLSAMGSTILANDRAERLPYIDRTFDQWRQDDRHPQAASATGGTGQFPDDAGTHANASGLFNQFPPGQPITTGKLAGSVFTSFEGSAMHLGAFAGFYDAGQTDANYSLQWVAPTDPGNMSSLTLNSISMSSTGGSFAKYADTGFNITSGGSLVDGLTFQLIRSAGGATNVASDNVWAAFGDIVILGQLVDRYGVNRAMSTTAHLTGIGGTSPSGYILASEVVEDLVGRVLTACDPGTAQIDATTAQIDQLAYYDASTASALFDDLALHEPDFLWEILESGTTGKFRFNFRAWPTTPRYVISTQDGYNAPGGEVDLCNRIAVNWTNAAGTQQVTVVTTSVAELGGAPGDTGARIKDAESVTLPEGQGSLANAQRVGATVLAAKNTPGRAATATVKRPVTDLLRGCMAMPWEINPGYLVRVMETGEDLRLTEVEYVDSDCAANLTLGSPVATTDQLIVRALQKK